MQDALTDVTELGASPGVSAGGLKHRFKDTAHMVKVANLMSEQRRLTESSENAINVSDSDSLKRDSKKKYIAVAVITLVFTCDALGELLTMPVMPYLYQSFPNASSEQLQGGLGIFAKEAEDIGVALTMNVGPSVFVLGGFTAMMMSPKYHKWFGKKKTFAIWTFGGAAGFVLCALAAEKRWGIGAFWFMRFFTGLFAGSEATSAAYMADLFDDPKERATMIATVAGLAYPLALLIGPVSAGYMIDIEGEETTLFAPFWFAAGMEFFAGVLVLLFVPNLTSKPLDSKSPVGRLPPDAKKEKTDVPVDKSYKWKTHVYIAWVATFFAEIGEGAMNHVQSMGFIRFPWIANNFTWVFMLFSLVIFIALPIALSLMQRSPAIACCAFRIISAILLGLVALPTSVEPYLLLVYIHYSFKMAAVTSSENIVMDLTPVEEREQYIAYDKALMMFMNGISPFLLVPLFLDNEKWGPYPDGCDNGANGYCAYSGCSAIYGSLCGEFSEGTFLIVTAICTAVSGLLYFPLFHRFPWKPPANTYKATPEEIEAKEVFEKSGDITWLSVADLLAANEKRGEEGQDPLTARFGAFADDKSCLNRIQACARRDFEYYNRETSIMLHTMKHGTPEEREPIVKMMEMYSHAAPPSDQDKQEFLEWVWNWMQYAGYGNPAQAPRMWKGLFMTAFPFILEDGERNPEFVEHSSEAMIRSERVIRGLLKMDRDFQSWERATKAFKLSSIRPRGL